jgi:hypothetical protein
LGLGLGLGFDVERGGGLGGDETEGAPVPDVTVRSEE